MLLAASSAIGHRGNSLANILRNLGLTSSLQGCYDFADINCYSGSGQTINDLSGQGNALFLGNSAGDASFDPAFAGTAGGLSAAERLTGGSVVIGGNQPSWMQAVHKDNGKISIAQWTRTTSGSYSMGGFFTDFKTDLSGFQYPGWAFGVADGTYATVGYPMFTAFDAAGTLTGKFNGTAVVGTGGWMFSACAIDEQAGTAVIQIDAAQYTGAISYSSPSAANSPGLLLLSPSGASAHDKNQFALWSVALSAANLNAIYNATKGRYA